MNTESIKRKTDTIIDLEVEQPQTKKQTNISSFFGGPTKPKENPKAKATKSSISSKRTLQTSTAEKWKMTS